MSAQTHPALLPVRRWVASRKEVVVDAVHNGEVTMADVQAAHGVSSEELTSWMQARRRYSRAGLHALKPPPRMPSRPALV